MASVLRSIPWIPIFLAVLVVGALIWLLYTDIQPTNTPEDVAPPIELIDDELETEIIEERPEPPSADEITQAEAETFVENLALSENKTITINENQDEFVRPGGIIALPDLEERTTTLSELRKDDSLDDDTELTLRYTERSETPTTLQATAEESDDHMAFVTIETEEGETITDRLTNLLEREDLDQQAPVTLLEERQVTREMTVGELDEADIDEDMPLEVTIDHGTREIVISDIIDTEQMADNSLLYLHRVTERDKEGLWGIINSGLIERFRRGLQLEGVSESGKPLRVEIPPDADQPLPSGLSSYLGRVLHGKVRTSYIYNFSTNSMGRDPNLIHPGQQLILIEFTQDELRDIYLFFAEDHREDVESFGIN